MFVPGSWMNLQESPFLQNPCAKNLHEVMLVGDIKMRSSWSLDVEVGCGVVTVFQWLHKEAEEPRSCTVPKESDLEE